MEKLAILYKCADRERNAYDTEDYKILETCKPPYFISRLSHRHYYHSQPIPVKCPHNHTRAASSPVNNADTGTTVPTAAALADVVVVGPRDVLLGPVGVGRVGVAVVPLVALRAKLAQAMRVLLAKWTTNERFPKNPGLPESVDVYRST
jgi:hypothetical protein